MIVDRMHHRLLRLLSHHGVCLACIINVAISSTPLSADTITFQDGFNGYTGTMDTYVKDDARADDNLGTDATISADRDVGLDSVGLLSFEIFGNGTNRIPLGTSILSATLQLQVGSVSGADATLHRMLVTWDENTTTYNSMTTSGPGIQFDDFEARIVPDAVLPSQALDIMSVDVTDAVVYWSAGNSNFGWSILPGNSTLGVAFRSSESNDFHPQLLVEIPTAVPEPQRFPYWG
ncbi:MAG: DNRLRE domain-containing protein [Planctomycetaceae bacterium]|nr:DNRLRE domain-containing protein [Planctomycetaceae bacterium]